MAVNAQDLLIQPFKDVIALAVTAAANATASADDETEHGVKVEQMLQSSKSLAREGERALRKVQAVWQSQMVIHGDAFGDRMLKQGSIENRRLRLEDLLWDFDDATHLAEFSQERYSALQAATKALALDITETTKRLRLDSPNLKLSTWPLRVFPPLPPLPNPPARRMTGTHSRKTSDQTNDSPMASSTPNGLPRLEKAARASSPSTSGHTNIEKEDLSRINPTSFPYSSLDLTASPVLPRETIIPFHQPGYPLNSREDAASGSSTTSESHRSQLSFWFQSSQETLNSSEPLPLLDCSSSDTTSALQGQLLSTPQIGSATDLTQHQKGNDLISPPPLDPQPPSIVPDQCSRVAARPPDRRITDCSSYKRFGGLCRGAIKFRADDNWTSIREVSEFSSLGTGSGGEMLRASDGIIPLQFEEATKVGRCSECYYSHGMDEVVLDKSLEVQGIRPTPSGANYRLRLLYKSHLRLSSPSSNLNPRRYACLWCISSSTTPREGDATVFPSPDHLLRHLATHPQPLPPLDGISVLHGRGAHHESSSSSSLKPFDLHLPNPAMPVPVPDSVARLPKAHALRDHVPSMNGRKLPTPPGYAGEMLEFLAGAVITGVMFPDRWDGKWCLGRHDGQFGAFPVKAVEVCKPTVGERPVLGGEGMQVVARWKWPPITSEGGEGSQTTEGKEGWGCMWLSFGKGELIYDVQCVHVDSWCWLGTNRQGKTGTFPKSHVDLRTLAARSKPAGTEKRKSKSFFGRRLAT